MGDKPVFEIGLAMAGAISAGAYSGGVFDFLCEALSEWDRARAGQIPGIDPDDVPNHQVCINVMSGASAGALTGAVGLLALAKGVRTLTPDIVDTKEHHTLPALYDAWVTKVDLASAEGNPDLLGLNDLKDGPNGEKAKLASVLDSSVLNWIAGQVVGAPPPPNARPAPFAWIAEPLHLYMMVTNLRGIPYGVSFDSNGVIDYHVMQCHGDRVHFAVKGLGSRGADNAFTRSDPVDGTFALVGATKEGLQPYIEGSLASSAFPGALAARKIDARAKYYETRMWPSLDCPIKPRWPDGYSPGDGTVLAYWAPDGGIIDNEPFEYAHAAILADGTKDNDSGADTATRAVIMIDPFPEAPEFDTAPEPPELGLMGMPGKLISALKNQARFKPDEVRKALDSGIYSRYLISPRLRDSDRVSSLVLATGLLGGFGGFLDQSFREYDYQLGRRNCQRFLKEHFTVGERNLIAFDKVSNTVTWPAAAYARQRDGDGSGKEIRIIPIYCSADADIVLPPRPRMNCARVKTILCRAKSRANAVVSRIFAENVGSSIARAALSVVWTFARGPALDGTVKWILLKGLIEADQLVELASTDANGKSKGDVARAVLIVAAALSDTKFDYCTRHALETALAKKGLAGKLDAAVASLDANSQPLFNVWKGQVGAYSDCFTWADRRPTWFMRQVSQAPKVNDSGDRSTDAM